MQSSVVAVQLLIATLVLSLGAFALYSVSFSHQYSTISVQEYLIGISKLISIEVSQLTFASVPPRYNYFNVSYVMWIQSPTKTLTVVAFVTYPQPNPSYILPSTPQNASLFTSSLNGYSSLRPFNLNATVYLPQGGQPLGNIHVTAYNISSNSTYVLSAVVRPGQIIMLWFLYYHDGKWYRLDYAYLSPSSSGIGVYIITGYGTYKGYSGTLNDPKPYINLTKTDLQIGMWFKPINTQQDPAPLLNATFIPINHTVGKIFSVILYTQGSSVYVNVSGTVKVLHNNLKAGQPYFINFTSGKRFNLEQAVKFTIYNKQGKQLNSSVVRLPSKLDGYTLSLTFGSKTVTNGIYQAFMVIEIDINQGQPNQDQGGNYQGNYQGQQGNYQGNYQGQQGIKSFWNVSNIALQNGPQYNNTYLFYWIIAHDPNLKALAYWYFVCPYNNPPPQLPGILWYWPSSKSKYPNIYYIPEDGINTYVLD